MICAKFQSRKFGFERNTEGGPKRPPPVSHSAQKPGIDRVKTLKNSWLTEERAQMLQNW